VARLPEYLDWLRDGVNSNYPLRVKRVPPHLTNLVTVPEINMLFYEGSGFGDSFLDFEPEFPEAFVYGLLDSILDLKQIEFGNNRITPLIRRSWFDIRIAITDALVNKARKDLDDLNKTKDN
jgi:hypothetical protein